MKTEQFQTERFQYDKAIGDLVKHLKITRCTKLVFTIENNTPIMATANFELDIIDGNKFVEIVKHFKLVELEQ